MFSNWGDCCGMNRGQKKDMISDILSDPKSNYTDSEEEDEPFSSDFKKMAVKDSGAKQQCLHVFPQEEKAYEKKHKIGSGGFGEVFTATCPEMGDDLVAIKILSLESVGCDIMGVFNEVNLMCSVKHPNILDLHATFPADDKLWVVMPYVRFGSVRQILDFAKPLAGSGGFVDEKLIATIMKQCLEALVYCHSQPSPIIHRDVKAANILIDETGNCLLMDFGVSKALEDHTTKKAKPGNLKRTNSYVGTASWMAPEVAAVDMGADGSCQSTVSYGTKADIWSFGITMMELAYGCPPHGNDGEAEFREFSTTKSKSKKSGESSLSWNNLSTRDKMTAVQHGPVVYKNMKNRHATMSDNFARCIQKCLQIDPEDRPTAKHLLKSSFFKKNAKDSDYIRKTLLSKINRDYLSNGGRSTATERKALEGI